MLIAPSTYYDHINRQPSRRQVRDETLKAQITRDHAANYGVYGARKVWLALNREGIQFVRLVSHACELTLNAFEAGLPVARWYI